ncbi:HAD family hydrolase [Oscillatoria sp. FACHB-1407]|uniref:HAD family hydrolase n=1 Tax=Oscillatoria sp. FACHB-1407 TaxID=2692847 RepID=UPI00168747E9|nr:HAD family hydrolase [Oscillatoria sp. FACHB-1407]MBD2460618.1 HAD family hydrolase [Oscillatoria sp. FACHB-1407]
MALQGLLLDVDGTLVLSNDAHAQAWVEAFAKFGYDIDFETVRGMIGMGGDRIMPQLVPGLNDEEGTGKEISAYRKQLVLEKFVPQLAPANGSRELLQKMQESGLKLVVASSASNEELGALLKAAQVDDLIQDATTSSDTEASKPAPDIVEAALNKGNFAPDEVVMLGDTPYDIESAAKAGVPVIAMRCGGFQEEQLKGAIAIYNDPADLLQHYDESPLAQAASRPDN